MQASRGRAFAIIFFTVFIDLIGFGIVIPLNPYLAREFGAGSLEVGLLMGIYSLMQFLMNPVWGRISDRIGRRPILLMGLAGSALSHLLFAFGDTLWLLFLARGLGGFFAATVSTAMAYVADLTDQKERSKSMGMVGAAIGLGFVVGPALGWVFIKLGEGWGTEPPLGPSFAAVGASAICLLNFLAALKMLPESRPAAVRGDPSKRVPRLQLILANLKRPVIGTLLSISALHYIGMANMEVSFFMLIKDRFGLSVGHASLGFAYIGVVIVFTQGGLVRRLIPKLGERATLLAGLAFAASGYVLIALSLGFVLLGTAVTVMGVGMGLIQPALSGSLSLSCGADEQGAILGANQSMAALGRILGPPIGGWIYGALALEAPFLLAATLSGGCLLLLLLNYSRLPQTGKTESTQA